MITTIYDAVVDLVGIPPAGLEPLVYVMSCVFLLFLILSAFSFIGAVMKWIGGK